MSVSRPGELTVGSQIKIAADVFEVKSLSGTQVELVDGLGVSSTVGLPALLADPSFALITPRPAALAPRGELESMPPEVLERARWWEGHMLELLTGRGPDGAPPRPEYEPAARSLRQRELTKRNELAALGHETSLRQLQRLRRRYETRGLWGLIDGRAARRPGAYTDERVLEAINRAIDAETNESTGTVDRLRRRVEQHLQANGVDPAEVMPSRPTFYRLVKRAARGRHTFASAPTRRSLAKRPDGPFGTVTAIRPGEWMLIDSTPLDVRVMLDNGIIDRVELTWIIDWATRSIPAALLRPSTKAVDAALLLARTLTPEPMRPGWAEALAMSRSVLPHARLVKLDERLRHAAARPVIVPETIVCDHGKAYRSMAFDNACRAMGINVQPTHKGSPWQKGGVERAFGSLNTLFAQYVAGYVGSSVDRRGEDAEASAVWSMHQLQELLDEWTVAAWQNRPHDGLRLPLTPGRALTPNEQYAVLVEQAGYVPVPLSSDNYIELLPAQWRAINASGIKISHRRYDTAALNPYRRQHSGVAAKKGLWEVHHDPYDVTRVWVRNHLDGGWITAHWTHLRTTPAPFGEQAWQRARQLLARRGITAPTEPEIADAVQALLDKAETGPNPGATPAMTRSDKRIAGRTRATANTPRPQPPTAPDTQPEPEAPESISEREDSETAAVIPLPIFDARKEAAKRW